MPVFTSILVVGSVVLVAGIAIAAMVAAGWLGGGGGALRTRARVRTLSLGIGLPGPLIWADQDESQSQSQPELRDERLVK